MGPSAPIVRSDFDALAATCSRICDRLLKQLPASPGASVFGINHQLADFCHRTLMVQLPLNTNVDKAGDLVFVDKDKATKRRAFKLPCKASIKCCTVKTGIFELAQQLVNRCRIACNRRPNHHGSAPLCEQTLTFE